MPKEPEVTTTTRSLVATGARVIHHSDAVEVKDWKSSTHSDIGKPQVHQQQVGKRQAVREAQMRAQIA